MYQKAVGLRRLYFCDNFGKCTPILTILPRDVTQSAVMPQYVVRMSVSSDMFFTQVGPLEYLKNNLTDD